MAGWVGRYMHESICRLYSVCMSVCMYVRMYIHVPIGTYLYVCTDRCLLMCVYICTHTHVRSCTMTMCCELLKGAKSSACHVPPWDPFFPKDLQRRCQGFNRIEGICRVWVCGAAARLRCVGFQVYGVEEPYTKPPLQYRRFSN